MAESGSLFPFRKTKANTPQFLADVWPHWVAMTKAANGV